MNPTKAADSIQKKIKESNSFLIVASRPVDFDCLGTALATQWWLNKLGKLNTRVVTFNWRNELADKFPDVEKVEFLYPDKVDFNDFDCIVLLDGSDWKQFLGDNWQDFVQNISKEKFVNIDHHTEGDVSKDLLDFSLRVDDSCTAKVLYEWFIKSSGAALDSDVATWLYWALMGDTGRFMYAIKNPGTYTFAADLYSAGVDHDKAVEYTVSKETMDFTVWAINKTKYYPEFGLTVLVIDEEDDKFLAEQFGNGWQERGLHKYYQQVFMRTIEGFPYAIDLWHEKNGGTKVGWRTKNGSKIEIMEIYKAIGVKVGGHRNAGGGNTDEKVSEVLQRFLNEIKLRV